MELLMFEGRIAVHKKTNAKSMELLMFEGVIKARI
jgi:hypothetical protein